MRLTLRTLLAYLDDTLEPAQAKLIGQKVAESEVARELIERIKNVTRRRRLAAPPAQGAGGHLDPNVVAEYIDNVLADEQVADVEEGILKSDVQLAEVAASHQILTLFLGQPAAVPPTAQQRMVDLVKGREAKPNRKSRRIAPTELSPDVHVEADEALLLGMPSYLRRHQWLRRLAPVGAILVLVVLLLVALWKIVPRGGSGAVARYDGRSTRGETTAAPEAVPPTTTEQKTPPDKGPEPKQPTPAPKQPDPEPKPPEVKQPIDQAPENRPSKERRVVGKYVSTAVPAPSVLLHRAAGGDQWQRFKPNDAVNSNDLLVSLPGYRSEVHLPSSVVLTLWGNLSEYAPLPVLESAAVLHVPPEGFDIDCTLDHGLIVLTNQKPVGKAKARVRFADEMWDLTLDENGSSVALNLWGEYPGGIPFNKEGKGEAPMALLDLFGLTGGSAVKIGYQTFVLPSPGWYRWDNTGPRSRAPQPIKREEIRWLLDKELPDQPQVRAASQALKDLAARLDKPGKGVGVALAEARTDSKGPVLVLSVFCLGAIGDLDKLVLSLGDDRGEVRWFANQTLRHWLGIRPENDLKLYKALQKLYPPLESESIMKLLHGFSRDDWRKVETYEWLIGELENKELALRELSFYHLWQRVPEAKKLPFDPGAGREARERGVVQWKKLLDEGKLPPKK